MQSSAVSDAGLDFLDFFPSRTALVVSVEMAEDDAWVKPQCADTTNTIELCCQDSIDDRGLLTCRRSRSAFNQTAVESAERKPLWSIWFEVKRNECCPVEFLPPVLAIDRALHPYGFTAERSVDAALDEHRHVSRR